MFSDCPDSFYDRRCSYSTSGGDARRCPAGCEVAHMKKIACLSCLIVFGWFVSCYSKEELEQTRESTVLPDCVLFFC